MDTVMSIVGDFRGLSAKFRKTWVSTRFRRGRGDDARWEIVLVEDIGEASRTWPRPSIVVWKSLPEGSPYRDWFLSELHLLYLLTNEPHYQRFPLLPLLDSQRVSVLLLLLHIPTSRWLHCLSVNINRTSLLLQQPTSCPQPKKKRPMASVLHLPLYQESRVFLPARVPRRCVPRKS